MTPLHFTQIQSEARRADLLAAAQRSREAQRVRPRSRAEHYHRHADELASHLSAARCRA